MAAVTCSSPVARRPRATGKPNSTAPHPTQPHTLSRALQTAAVAAARTRPHAFVMKPQREGGGNNIYGEAVKAALAPEADGGLAPDALAGEEMGSTPLWAVNRLPPGECTHASPLPTPPRPAPPGYILMERVFPARENAYFVRAGAVASLPAVCELGIYGVYLGDGRREGPLLNASAGHLVRTKTEGTDEGGVAAGFAVLDSPFLV